MARKKTEFPFTREELSKHIRYDSETGFIYRLYHSHNSPSKNKSLDEPIGSPNVSGHLMFSLLQKRLYNHHVAWIMLYDTPLPECIDHINHNPSDNRACNLRAATPAQNGQNALTRSEEKGLHHDKRNNRWLVYVQCNRKRYQKSFPFDQLDAARTWLTQLRLQLHGEFACL